MTAPLNVRTGFTSIELGRVLDVDIDNYTLTVATKITKRCISGVSFATPYQHPAAGEGIYFMPEVGSLCWLCIPSDDPNYSFVLGWASAQEEDSFRSRKMDLNPGDIYLGTRDDNFLILRRGGVVQIGGGSLSQRLFIPLENLIRDICENYELQTLGGSLTWTLDHESTTPTGKQPAILKLSAREYASEDPIATLQIGSHGFDSEDILTLSILDKGAGAEKISLQMGKTGDLGLKLEGAVTWTVAKTLDLSVSDNAIVASAKTITLQGNKVVINGKVEGVEINGGPSVKIAAATVAIGQQLSVGGDAGGGTSPTPLILASSSFIKWLSTHVHVVTAMGSPSGPPTSPPPELSPFNAVEQSCVTRNLKST